MLSAMKNNTVKHTETIIHSWIKDRNTSPNKNIIVTNRLEFEIWANVPRNLDDVAYISISSTADCANTILGDINETNHYLPNSDKVLNLNFDDVTEDTIDYDKNGKQVLYKAITFEQAEQIVSFVENNNHKHLIIHCKDGKSRSQGVCRAILDM